MARWPLPADYTRDERVARLERNLAALDARVERVLIVASILLSQHRPGSAVWASVNRALMAAGHPPLHNPLADGPDADVVSLFHDEPSKQG